MQRILFSTLVVFLISGFTFQCSLFSGNVPKAVKAAFEAKYPDAKDVSWGIDSNGFFEAKFEINDKKYRADFLAGGEWVETESSIKFSDLPQAVKDAVKRDYDKDDIEEVEEVDHPKKGIFYDVELDGKGYKKVDIEYNALGEKIGTSS